MNRDRIFACTERSAWRAWLAEHFETEIEIWFVFPTKASGEPGVSYNDAVEEALCFGWIDGQAGTLDETHQLRRFTPRRKGSTYSRPNVERLIRLDAEGLIHPKVRPSVEALIRAPFVFPEDILDEIRKDAAAWAKAGIELPLSSGRTGEADGFFCWQDRTMRNGATSMPSSRMCSKKE